MVRWGRQVLLWLLTGTSCFLFCFSIRPAAQQRAANSVGSAPDAPTLKASDLSDGFEQITRLFLPLNVLHGTSGSHHRPSGVIKKTWWLFPRAPSGSASREGIARENGVFGRRLHHAAVHVTDVCLRIAQDPFSSAGGRWRSCREPPVVPVEVLTVAVFT